MKFLDERAAHDFKRYLKGPEAFDGTIMGKKSYTTKLRTLKLRNYFSNLSIFNRLGSLLRVCAYSTNKKLHLFKVAFHLPVQPKGIQKGTKKFSELVLARMSLLVDQSRSVLPLPSAKAREFAELWRKKCSCARLELSI